MQTKLYRAMVSIIVEAYDEDDAVREVMNEIFDDTMVVESVSEISVKKPEHETQA